METSEKSKFRVLRLMPWLVMAVGFLGLVTSGIIGRDWRLFEPECLYDGQVHGQRTVSPPLDAYYLSEVAALAERGGFGTWQIGYFLLVTRERVAEPEEDFANAVRGLRLDPWEQLLWWASIIDGSYHWKALDETAPTRGIDPNFLENRPSIAHRIRLLETWWDEARPPGNWGNAKTDMGSICYALRVTLRPEWLQLPGSRMSRLLWADRWERFTAWISTATGEPGQRPGRLKVDTSLRGDYQSPETSHAARPPDPKN